MNDFYLWFSTGLWHIADWQGFDHILFVSLLVFAFPFNEWKKLLILVSAFTLGHSVSLALGVTATISAPRAITELLIGLTLLASAAFQLATLKKTASTKTNFLYVMVGIFGLIHGLGFSYLLSSMLGHNESVFWPLLYFNLGIETGQLLIVTLVVLFSLLLTRSFKLPYQLYKQITVWIIALTALKLCVERLQDLY